MQNEFTVGEIGENRKYRKLSYGFMNRQSFLRPEYSGKHLRPNRCEFVLFMQFSFSFSIGQLRFLSFTIEKSFSLPKNDSNDGLLDIYQINLENMTFMG